MAHFQKDAYNTPFGIDEFLRSTQDIKTKSATVAKGSVPPRTIDGNTGQVILRKGTVLAKITSGPDTGKVGPFQAAGTAEVTRLTPSGTISGGTFTISGSTPNVNGVATAWTTAAIAFNATAATVAAAVNAALLAANTAYYVNGSGGPINSAFVDLTWGPAAGDVTQPTVNGASLTGSTPAITPTTNTAGVAGATDGRGNTANIVGICNTFLPYQLRDRDVEVAVVYEASVVQANCFELNGAGTEIPLSNTTATAMHNQKSLDIRFPA